MGISAYYSSLPEGGMKEIRVEWVMFAGDVCVLGMTFTTFWRPEERRREIQQVFAASASSCLSFFP